MSASDRQPAHVVSVPKEGSDRAKRKRMAARESRVLAGVDELSRFLEDLLRQGLASASATGYRSWDEMASRMVDAQAPGLARMVRELGGVTHAGKNWQDAMLERIGRLHLLLEAYRRVDALDDDLAADVRSLVGFTTRRDAVLATPVVRDTWWVLGRRLELQDNLSTARTWMWGETTRRFALVLSFAAGGQRFDTGPSPGSHVDADVHFYPGSVPLRALIATSRRTRKGTRFPIADVFRPLGDEWNDHQDAAIRLPWLERFPMALRGVFADPGQDGWRVHDGRNALPMQPFGQDGWTMLALGAGQPAEVFGEWTGTAFVPFGCFGEEGHVALARNPLYAELER